jgi:hypothetical protein
MSHPGAGKCMMAVADFSPDYTVATHELDTQLPLTREEIVYVNCGSARVSDGMVKVVRLRDFDEQGYVPFTHLVDLADDEQARLRYISQRAASISLSTDQPRVVGASPGRHNQDPVAARVAQVHGSASLSARENHFVESRSSVERSRAIPQLRNEAYVPVDHFVESQSPSVERSRAIPQLRNEAYVPVEPATSRFSSPTGPFPVALRGSPSISRDLIDDTIDYHRSPQAANSKSAKVTGRVR